MSVVKQAVDAGLIPAGEAKLYESLALRGDISGLTAEERVGYYARLCDRIGLDPYTQPLVPLKLNGKEILYASRGATDQMAAKHNVTREIVNRERVADVYVVTARATLPSGRHDDSTGAVALGHLQGEALANALMKAETKAKRRATLSLLGLGLLDESEMDTIPAAAIQPGAPVALGAGAVNTATGEVMEDDPADPWVRMTEPEPQPVAGAPPCPVCGGRMYDNRVQNDAKLPLPQGKRLPPDYVCRNKPTCEGKYWRGQWPPKAAEPDAPPSFDDEPEPEFL
jgi:hypothetical protein